jgi:transposase
MTISASPDHRRLHAIVNDLTPRLPPGQESDRSAPPRLPCRFSYAGRCRNDAAFARLAGTSPIEASSGLTIRHREKAIHVIANTRIRSDPAPRPTSPVAAPMAKRP